MGLVRRVGRTVAALLAVLVPAAGLSGCHVAATVEGRVWEDIDRDGQPGESEPPVKGVFLRILCLDERGERDCAPRRRSDRDGIYEFRLRSRSEAPLRFVVEVEVPTGYAVTGPHWGEFDSGRSAINPATSRSVAGVLDPGDKERLIVGLYRLGVGGAIEGRVWNDRDGDGTQDAEEDGFQSLRVHLRDASSSLIATRSSTETGAYAFGGLGPGSYVIEVVPHEPFVFAPRDRGDDATDSDVGPDGFSEPIVLGRNATADVDAGLISTSAFGSVSGRVFRDLDRDGSSIGEPGISGIAVHLLEGDGDAVMHTSSMAFGFYAFEDVPPGSYRVRFELPDGFGFTSLNQGDNERADSDVVGADGSSEQFTVGVRQRVEAVDAGLLSLVSGPGAVGDFVWEDVDRDGLQDPGEPGLAGVGVTLRRRDGTFIITTTSGADGRYGLVDVPPGGYVVHVAIPAGFTQAPQDAGNDDAVDSDVGDFGVSDTFYVYDLETTDTVDAGFVRGTGDAAIGGFAWEDADADGIQDPDEHGMPGLRVRLVQDGAIGTAFTDENGLYEFPRLTAGSYFVKFDRPEVFHFTEIDQGADDTIDSDVREDGFTNLITVAAGERDLSVDAGLIPSASLGDLVWEDLDGDGNQDANEPGVPDVVVALVRNGDQIRTAVTDGNGHYRFSNLGPGVYVVRFNIPGGFDVTDTDQGADDGLDSDVDATGQTQPVSLGIGQVDLSVDAGLVRQPTGGASVGDRVWQDIDGDGLQDASEPGLANVVVILLDGDGVEVAQTATDDGGIYRFAGLAPDTYRLRFADLRSSGFFLTAFDVGGDDALDSDAHPATRETTIIVLFAGEQNDTVDAGYTRQPS